MEPKGIWVDIHIGSDEKNPEFTKRKMLVWPRRCGNRSLQEYFVKYEKDVAHRFMIRLTEIMKELDLEKYRQAKVEHEKIKSSLHIKNLSIL